jgi:uncharacterized protein YndB with AHSA1/START domain
MKQEKRIVGLTKDVGFQIGVRRTLPIHHEEAWRKITSPDWIHIWLGEKIKLNFVKGEKFTLTDGSSGEVRVYKKNSHLRITWQPPHWQKASTIQIRVIAKNDKSVFAFHQEHLPNAEEREKRRIFFSDVLDRLATKIPQ